MATIVEFPPGSIASAEGLTRGSLFIVILGCLALRWGGPSGEGSARGQPSVRETCVESACCLTKVLHRGRDLLTVVPPADCTTLGLALQTPELRSAFFLDPATHSSPRVTAPL